MKTNPSTFFVGMQAQIYCPLLESKSIANAGKFYFTKKYHKALNEKEKLRISLKILQLLCLNNIV